MLTRQCRKESCLLRELGGRCGVRNDQDYWNPHYKRSPNLRFISLEEDTEYAWLRHEATRM